MNSDFRDLLKLFNAHRGRYLSSFFNSMFMATINPRTSTRGATTAAHRTPSSILSLIVDGKRASTMPKITMPIDMYTPAFAAP